MELPLDLRMRFPSALFWSVLAVAATVLALQLLVLPIVGLADQGDFARIVGKFGYGPERRPQYHSSFG
jgi:hypothetical protein